MKANTNTSSNGFMKQAFILITSPLKFVWFGVVLFLTVHTFYMNIEQELVVPAFMLTIGILYVGGLLGELTLCRINRSKNK